MNYADIMNVLILVGLGYVVKLLWDLKDTSKSKPPAADSSVQKDGGRGENR